MTDIPILFSAEMVRAWLEGRKRMTRRYAWRRPSKKKGSCGLWRSPWCDVQPGDRLWVRENHWRWGLWDYQPDREQPWKFFAEKSELPKYDGEMVDGYEAPKRVPGRLAWYYRPSIYMERAHSRLTLMVEGTKCEPLQAITIADILAEGIPDTACPADFPKLWNRLNGKGSWEANPEVVAITARAVATNIDAAPPAQYVLPEGHAAPTDAELGVV